MNPVAPIAGSIWLRHLRVFICWLGLSGALLMLRHHQDQERHATIHFTVAVEGRKERPSYLAELNQTPFVSGEHSGLWNKTLRIKAPDAELFVTNLFIWYGGKDLGKITLARVRGTLALDITSPALHVTVRGDEAIRVLSNATHEFIPLPTGRYKVEARFTRFTTYREMEIAAHQVTPLVINPGITALALDSQPTDAEFELTSVLPAGVSVRSNTPVILTDLPSGDYHLRIWRDEYERTVPLKLVASDGTNKFAVEFDYATLTINSAPSAAKIHTKGKMLGTTPATLTLPTGLHRLTVGKEGFSPTNFSIELVASEKRALELRLKSVAFVSAMQRARDFSLGNSVDLDRALEEVNNALQISPDDEDALSLKRSITFSRRLRNAREFGRNREWSKALREIDAALQNANHPDALSLKREWEREEKAAAQASAEARKEYPRKVFEDAVTRFQHQNLFPSQTVQVRGELATVRSKVMEGLGRKPAWTVQRNDSAGEEVSIIHTEFKGFGVRQSALLVMGQTADNEVTIHFKLLISVLGNNVSVGLRGVSEESYVPLHSSSAAIGAINAESRRATHLEEFKKRIQVELP